MNSGAMNPTAPIERYVWRIAGVTVLGAIMSVLDTTIVNVALQTLGRDLHSSLDDIQWVVTGYLLALAAVIPASGWAARRYGAKRVYIWSLVLFTLGSVLCGLAWSTESLVFFRVLQGIGGGLIMPVGQIITARAAGPARMGRVMGMLGVVVVLAPVVGPTVGGLLVEHLGWEWIFFVNVPIGIVAVAAALRILPADEPEAAGRFDFLGLGLLAPGLVGIVYGLAEVGSTGGASSPKVLVPLIGGALLTVAFVLHAWNSPRPLLDLRLFSNRAFAAAATTTFCLGAALFGAMILMPLYFQTVRGEDAVATGLLVGPQGIGAAIAMGVSGRLADRVGGGKVAVVGIIITAITTLPFVFIDADTSYLFLGLAMAGRGFGIGSSFMPAMTAAFKVLRPDQVSDASPQLNVIQRVGGSLGTAILTVVLQNHIDAAGPQPTPDQVAGAFGTAYAWALAVGAIALVPAVVLAIVEARTARTAAALAREESLEAVAA